MNDPWDKIKPPVRNVEVLRADPKHPLDFFWGRDNFRRYLFVYEYPSDSDTIINQPPDLVGVETLSLSAAGNKSRLVLILKEKVNWELFYALCHDLLNATTAIKDPKIAPATILRRLRRWQEFLKRQKLDILSEEKIKGLVGELLFLRNQLVPIFGGSDAVKFWIGPDGAPQDFNIKECVVEVKCQLGGTRPNVKISSADQLYSQLPYLYLFVVTLGKTTKESAEAVNLPSLIAEITGYLEDDLSSLNHFQDQLMQVGYYYSEKYFDYNYSLLGEQVFFVSGGFPRICPNDLRAGVIKLSYNVDLLECMPFEIDINDLEFNL